MGQSVIRERRTKKKDNQEVATAELKKLRILV